MQELLRYLRANGFKTFIVSGGGATLCGCGANASTASAGAGGRLDQPHQVELGPSGPVLVKTLDFLFVDDKAGKPVGIHEFIGRRPIAAFGNSDGDKEMLEYATIDNPRPSLGLIVHHTDAKREYAYDANPQSTGKLVEALHEALERGWVVVDMAQDWNRIFAFEP